MKPDLLHGALDLLILDVVARGRSYGYQIAQAVLDGSGRRLEVKEGSLYPALHRLEHKKLLRAEWGESPEGRRRKYYRLTPAGVLALEQKRQGWLAFAQGVQGVLDQPKGAPG